jgi:hypothetical protein
LLAFAAPPLPIVSRAFDAHPLPIGDTPLDRLMCFDERVDAEIPVSEVEAAVRGGFRPHPGWPDVGARAATDHPTLAGAAGSRVQS